MTAAGLVMAVVARYGIRLFYDAVNKQIIFGVGKWPHHGIVIFEIHLGVTIYSFHRLSP